MNRRYSIDTKIDALNLIDEHDGNVTPISESLEIPLGTLHGWLRNEATLRKKHSLRRQRQSERLTVSLQLEMLERSKAILKQMNNETLEKAPLNQLASALGSLISHALKLEEVIEEIDEDQEKVIRFEYYYDGQVQEAPPWAGARDRFDREVQGGRLRETLGQDRAGQSGHLEERALGQPADLVAGADLLDGESGLARLEGERQRD